MQRDEQIFDLILEEQDRQIHGLELIASENFVSDQVMEAAGSVLTNKYAEGYPGKRYYGGCEVVDVIEQIAIDRAKALFGAEYVNVQPHSGSQANTAVFAACLKPGDKILGFDLSHGGHLTHGSPVNFSGKLYNSIFYGVEQETGRLNYDKIQEVATKEQPKLIIAGASAYSRDMDFKRFREIADSGRSNLNGRYFSSGRFNCQRINERSDAALSYRNNYDAQNITRTSRRYDHDGERFRKSVGIDYSER